MFGPTPGEVLGLRTYGDVQLENLKIYAVPESNSRLSRSKLFLNNTPSFSFFGQSCALPENLSEIYRKLWKYCHPSDLNHIRGVQMAYNDLSESKMTNTDPIMESIFTNMIPCLGVRILEMIASSAARPRTEKYMSTSSGGPTSVNRYLTNLA